MGPCTNTYTCVHTQTPKHTHSLTHSVKPLVEGKLDVEARWKKSVDHGISSFFHWCETSKHIYLDLLD